MTRLTIISFSLGWTRLGDYDGQRDERRVGDALGSVLADGRRPTLQEL